MIYMITIVLSFLVTLNFILLKFSCNKTTKRLSSAKPFVLKKHTTTLTTQSAPGQLAATGS